MHPMHYIIFSDCLDKTEQCKPFHMLVGSILNLAQKFGESTVPKM